MWQMISEQTSWGSFSERLKELAENRQRPGGKKVLRDDGNGTEREYYLYEITATVYPKRAGQIDASDVQVVVNYPTELGQSRDPFASMFGGSPFGSRGMSSRIQQMMGDDFFGGSPFGGSAFGNRLAVTSSRPIVGQAAVDSTQVVPVPTAGRPADYRGAVGRYKIITQATPSAVNAGDPITLNIGVLGTGPMELVQAPPLSELSSLTADFKVEDQSLAGFVKDETKVFPTTIRPRHEGITQIPAIPFSFFDPDTETFQTVMSEPISITVEKSESLALDAIVGNGRRSESDHGETAAGATVLKPDFANDHSASVLVTQSPASASNLWWVFVVVPPFVWLATSLVRNRETVGSWVPSFKSADVQCLAAIDRAKDRTAIENAMAKFVSKQLGKAAVSASPVSTENQYQSVVGQLRTSGLYRIASAFESFFQQHEHAAFSGSSEPSLAETKHKAKELVTDMNAAFDSMNKSQVRRAKTRQSDAQANVRRRSGIVQKACGILLALMVAFSAGNAFADGDLASTQANNEPSVQLSDSQRQTILQEAGVLYDRAIELTKTDQAEANDLFSSATAKYQLLVDAGIRNAGLYIDLGNAYLQSNQLGHAIANYERAKHLDPTNRQLQANLELANSLVAGQPAEAKVAASLTSFDLLLKNLRDGNAYVTNTFGSRTVVWTLALSSLVFWSVFITRAAGYTFPAKRWAVVPLCVMAVAMASVVLSGSQSPDSTNAIVVVKNVAILSGDGQQFPEITTLESAQGHRVTVLGQRVDWVQVKTVDGHVGWVEDEQLEIL